MSVWWSLAQALGRPCVVWGALLNVVKFSVFPVLKKARNRRS